MLNWAVTLNEITVIRYLFSNSVNRWCNIPQCKETAAILTLTYCLIHARWGQPICVTVCELFTTYNFSPNIHVLSQILQLGKAMGVSLVKRLWVRVMNVTSALEEIRTWSESPTPQLLTIMTRELTSEVCSPSASSLGMMRGKLPGDLNCEEHVE